MPSLPRARARLAQWRGWLPLAILLAALASLFVLGGDRAYFRREGGSHNELSVKNLAIAENLSLSRGLRLATRVWRNEDGGLGYDLYSRFPIGGYALIKLAILPFGGDLSAGLTAARLLMLLALCGAALFCWLAIARISGSRWIALAAVLTAFSGFYVLYFADAVSSETSVDLFGAMLTFHGMVVFTQEGRFRQLLVKTCAALFLGWHAYAPLAPFIALGFGGEAAALVRSAIASGGGIRAALAALPALVRSRYAVLAAVAVLFGSALLAFNLANEYAAFGGGKPLSELPSARSAAIRTSLDKPIWESYAETLGESKFWGLQFMRAGAASVPYALAPSLGDGQRKLWGGPLPAAAVITGVLAAGAAAALALISRHRIPLATLALFGFCWSVAASGNAKVAHHYHEGIFFIGVPLTIITVALMGARSLMGERGGGTLAVGLGAASAAVFALSVFCESRPYEDEVGMAAEFDMAALSELRAIRDETMGKPVMVSSDIRTYLVAGKVVEYALGGGFTVYEWETLPVDFTVSRYRNETLDTLTPDNRFVFLYRGSTDPAALRRAERRRLEASEPAARSVFDVYLEDDTLRYLKSPCVPKDAEAHFFAHFFPPDAAFARGGYDPAEFDGVNFRFSASGKIFDGACIATAHLPDYPIAAIRTGQFVSDSPAGRGASEEGAWEVYITPPPSADTLALYESAYQAIASGAPSARSGFDLYLDGGALTYLKQPCSKDDVRGRFFLSVHPADVDDLPEDRREMGHESLNFDFIPPHGALFNGKCMATRQLPDYEIAKIETGQWIPGGERLWDAEIAVGD